MLRTPFSLSGISTDDRAVFGTTTRSSMLRFRVFHFRIVGVSFLPVFSDRENHGRSGQRETQRGVCSGEHGKRARQSDTSYRVAKHSSDRSLAQRPLPQVVLRQGRVAKGTSIGTLARGPSTEALLGQGRVPKERKSVPLTGLWSG